jgi:hypothetical protein
MGTRDKSADVDFSGVLEQEVEDALKAAAQISMGTEISEEDLSNIIALCDQVGLGDEQNIVGLRHVCWDLEPRCSSIQSACRCLATS